MLGVMAAALGVVLMLGVAGCSDAVSAADKLVTKGDYAAAEKLYRGVVASHPNDVSAVSGLAVVLTFEKKYNEALGYQEREVQLDPTDAQTRVELGFNYLNHQNRSADAVRVFKEAVAINGHADAWTFLAQAQIACGDTASAEQSLRQAIHADPSYPHAYVVLMDLLKSQSRSQEAQDVAAQAASRGVQVADGQK